jgi:tRNA dimethylallyltransferase
LREDGVVVMPSRPANRRPILLTGPTASGKSELAMRLAERDTGTVINADALQVYACWRILSARPSAQDTARAPHALYGHVPAQVRYSVGQWLDDLGPVLEHAARLGQRPIVVGGTGLYLTSLTEGLAQIPQIDPTVRARSQALINADALDALRDDLRRCDPQTFARIDAANPMRVQRAWEVLTSTGRGLCDWQAATPPAMLPRTSCDCYVLHPRVPLQHLAIERRFRRMVATGALDECEAFLRSGDPLSLPAARALGAEPLIDHLRGDCALEDAIARSVIATRQFSKRQRTWFRRRMSDWTWLDPGGSDLLDQIPSD